MRSASAFRCIAVLLVLTLGCNVLFLHVHLKKPSRAMPTPHPHREEVHDAPIGDKLDAMKRVVENLRSDLEIVASSTPNLADDEKVPPVDDEDPLGLSQCASDFPTRTQQIPRSVHLMWKSDILNDEAQPLDEMWRRQEPCFSRRVVDDEECSRLAHLIPRMQPAFDRLPLNVMRADTCRVLAVWAYGGVYMDLDVAPVKPFREWFNTSADIIVGTEVDEQRVACNWFFAARPRHPCIRRSLEVIASRIDRNLTAEDFKKNQHLVHGSTGPQTFSEGIRDCAPFTLTSEQLIRTVIEHRYGSTSWQKSPGYESWRDEVVTLRGGKIEHLGEAAVRYANTRPAEILGVTGSPNRRELRVANAQLLSPSTTKYAFIQGVGSVMDDNLATTLEGGLAYTESAFVITLAAPLVLSGAQRLDGALNCVRLLNSQDGEAEGFDGLEVVVLNSRGVKVYESGPRHAQDAGRIMVEPRQMTGGSGTAKRVMVWRKCAKGTVCPIHLAEVQFFTDVSCSVPCKLRIAPGRVKQPDGTFGALLVALTVSEAHPCNEPVLVGDHGAGQYVLCLDRMILGPALVEDPRLVDGLVGRGMEVHLVGRLGQTIGLNPKSTVTVKREGIQTTPHRVPFTVRLSDYMVLNSIDGVGALEISLNNGAIAGELLRALKTKMIGALFLRVTLCDSDGSQMAEELLVELLEAIKLLKSWFSLVSGTVVSAKGSPCVIHASFTH